jgi:hypothetical protein
MIDNKYTGSILDVLKSKRFISSAVLTSLMLLSAFVPQLEENFEQIAGVLTVAIVMLVTGYSFQDVVIAVMTGGYLNKETPETESLPTNE